jgi:hypothetical protein
MENQYKFIGEGLSVSEKRWGCSRFQDYLNSFAHLNKLGNIQLLEELVWKEVIQERYKKQIGALGKVIGKNTDGSDKIEPVNKQLQEAADESLRFITELKTKLGMFEDQKTTDAFKEFLLLRVKAAEYRKAHPLSFKTTCPFCARAFYLKRRTEHFEEFKSPFAEDKVVNNKPLFKLYKDGKLTKEDVRDVLGVSLDYVDWLDENVYGNKKQADAPKIDETPTADEPPATPPATPES